MAASKDVDEELEDYETCAAESQRLQEVLGIVCLAGAVMITMAISTREAEVNAIGALGGWFVEVLFRCLGYAVWIIPTELGLLSLRLFRKQQSLLGLHTAATTFALLVLCSAASHIFVDARLSGGILGELVGEMLLSVLGDAGALIATSTLIGIVLLLRSPYAPSELLEIAWTGARALGSRLRALAIRLAEAWQEAKEIEQTIAEEEAANGPTIIAPPAKKDEREEEVEEHDVEDVFEQEDDEEADEPSAIVKKPRSKKNGGPKVVAPQNMSEPSRGGIIAPAGTFVCPPTRILSKSEHEELRIDPSVLRDNAARLEEKLQAYGVHGRVDEIHPGPVVTMYEFEPKSGTKISKIAGLADDLAMALAAQKVRIVAPIPGKARVGFELPNDERQTVHLRDVLEDGRWERTDSALPIALGRDIGGQPVYGDLSKMPHLLVAGATGAGKSVGLNVMLCSLLQKKSPEEVRFLMIDPKVVELAVFDGIPHMLLPVVTDMNKAALALKWAVDEMERRYQLFADAGARNIKSFNTKVQKVLDGELAPEKLTPSRAGKVVAKGAHGEEVLLDPSDGEIPDAVNEKPDKLPYVVVVVDEFADLMMVAAKDVEAAIARLAQKARAAGIHVILATQRPSVDVITGMIKANFPARIAFKVSQREDSKTILGRTGAEHLLGMGDMLMIPPGSSDLKRVHSAYISEDDVREMCDFLRAQGKPIYDEEILKPREEDDFSLTSSSDDPLYDRAVAVVADAGYCSISHVQRKLGIGYNKAANLVEKMEQEGVVGPPSKKAGGRREVLVGAA